MRRARLNYQPLRETPRGSPKLLSVVRESCTKLSVERRYNFVILDHETHTSRKALPLGLHRLMLAIACGLFALVTTFVDLRPVVDENFFFSTSDPGIQQTKKIEHQFPSPPEVILTVSSRDISSSRYLGRIQKLAQRVRTIGGVSAVKSLAEGPKSFEDAIKSPFWSRLLIAPDRKASNVIIFMKGRHTERPIRKLEQIVHELDGRDFRIHIAGPPYVVEMLRRSLEHDFHYFTLTAIVLFGLTMTVLFRSVRLFVGMLCTCASAVLLTLLLQSLLGHKIGILTVNLGTIVFIVALSPLIYMTFNWQTLADRAHRIGKESPDLALDARRMTFPPSLWSMVCAYPSFLRWAVPRKTKLVEVEPTHPFWSRRFALLSLGVIVLGVVLGFGLPKVNTYEAYQKMWRLHGALENEKDVGTVISLPTLLAEGDRTPFSFLISYEKMMEIMSQAKYARVARSFVSEDRRETVFTLRMVEAHRTKCTVSMLSTIFAPSAASTDLR